MELARHRFYWPRMQNNVENFIKKKCRCIISKKPCLQDRAPLVPINSYPFELVSIDYCKLDRCKGGFEYALVCIDHFTKFVQMYPTKNKNGIAAADKIYNDLVLKYGFPTRIHHDQGKEFTNDLFKRLHQLSGTKQSQTTPYHPMGNGQTERMNRTMIEMLTALGEKEKKDWSKHLQKLSFAYNATVHKATGYSPYYLMFGRSPRLPIDSLFQLEPEMADKNIRVSYRNFAEDWQRSMNEAFEIVRRNTKKSSQTNKNYYDRKARGVKIVAGDRVLLKNREKTFGTAKLINHWEDRFIK